MATIALYALGAAAGGAIWGGTAAAAGVAATGGFFWGGQIGLMVGAYIDTSMLAKFGAPEQPKGAHVNGFDFSGWDEGAPIARAFGTSTRVAGQVIYVSELIETEHSTSPNGKGGSGGAFVEYSYSCHVAVAICRGEIGAVKRVFANNKVIWDASPDVTESSALISGVASTVSYVIHPGNPGSTTQHLYHLKLLSPDGGPDLGAIKVGKPLHIDQDPTLPGWTNYGDWNVLASGTNADGSSFVKVERREVDGDVAFVSFSAGTPVVQVFQSQPASSAKTASLIGFHLGEETQGVNAFFEGLVGAGEWPAYRGTAWAEFRDFQLFDYGNVLPQFTFEVENDAGETIATAIGTLLDDAGLTSGQRDTSALVDALVGYTVRDTASAGSAIAPLMVAFETMSYEQAGAVVFFKRADATQVTIPEDRLAAHEIGQSAPRDISVSDTAGDDTPSQIVIKYLDEDKDDQTGTQRDRRVTASREVIAQVDVPVVMSSTRARELSSRMLWTGVAATRALKIQLPPSQIGRVREGKLALFDANGESWKMLVLRVDRGVNHMLIAEGIQEQPHLFESAPDPAFSPITTSPGLGKGTQHQTFTAQPVVFHIMDCAALSDEHQRSPGFYIAACLSSISAKFTGGAMYESIDGGVNYQLVRRIRQAATIGSTLDTLAYGVVGLWDDVSTVDVELVHGELESVREAQCLAGANRAMVGTEIIGFQFAELIDTNTYRLSHLLRGLRDTAGNVSLHDDGDRFILLTGPGIEFHPMSVASIGTERTYKIVTNGGALDDFAEQTTFPQGENVKPFAVCSLTAVRNGSGDVVVSWLRRTRAIVRLLSPQAIPLLEPWEKYVVEWTDSTTGEVYRTSYVDYPGATYSLAEQTLDGTTATEIDVVVYQAGDIMRRGRPATVYAI